MLGGQSWLDQRLSEVHLWRTCNWDGGIHVASNTSHLFRFGNPSNPTETSHRRRLEEGERIFMKRRSPTAFNKSPDQQYKHGTHDRLQ
jgi:hypothetical protein